jgi:DNA helicase-2/ATP-dependent DNA helicase PcrA
MRLRADSSGFARDLIRPMPRPPAPRARLGTRFHAWVEARFGQQALFDPDDLPGAADDAALPDDGSDEDLTHLQDAFLRTPYAERAPYRLEQPFQLRLRDRVVRGRIDAVYRTRQDDGTWRYEVVDWKTNRVQNADPFQLAIYRVAWAELSGVDVDAVDAVFLYVRDGRVVRPRALPARSDLEAVLTADR